MTSFTSDSKARTSFAGRAMMVEDDLDRLTWDPSIRSWNGRVALPHGGTVEVSVASKNRDKLALGYARPAFDQVVPRIDDGRRYAAHLLEYYNEYNAHVKNGEQLDEVAFAGRMELEGICF